jgi:hypothetical protein
MKRALLLLPLTFVVALTFAADEIILPSGTVSKGWIIQISPQSIFAIADGGRKNLPLQSTLKFDLAAQPRIVYLLTKKDEKVLISLNAWTNLQIQGETAEGKAWTCTPADVKAAVFYPCSRFARTLPVTHVKQKPDYCGEACVEMVSEYLARKVTQDDVNKAGGLDGKRGVYAEELEKAILQLKLKTAPVSAGFEYKTPEDMLLDFWQLVRDIDRNKPVLLGFWANPDKKSEKFNFDHFVLLVGYDLTKQSMIIHDPAGEASWSILFAKFQRHRQTKTSMAYHIEFPFSRRWTLRDGKKIDSEGMELAGEQLKLKVGQNFESVPIANLSDEDQAFLKKLK